MYSDMKKRWEALAYRPTGIFSSYMEGDIPCTIRSLRMKEGEKMAPGSRAREWIGNQKTHKGANTDNIVPNNYLICVSPQLLPWRFWLPYSLPQATTVRAGACTHPAASVRPWACPLPESRPGLLGDHRKKPALRPASWPLPVILQKEPGW